MFNIRKAGIAYFLIILIFLGVICRIVDIQFIHKPTDRSVIKRTQSTEKLECTRGSIMACDGRYLAFSIPEYRLAFDPSQAVDTLFDNGIDELSRKLSAFYKDKKASEYKRMIVKARKDKKRFIYINKKLVPYQDMKELSSFPIFRAGQRRGGVRFEKVDHRTYPYGRLGFRTLGYIKDQTEKPLIGIEGSCDSILRGTPGIQPTRLTEGNHWIPDYDRETIYPVDGRDVQITLDVDIQDIAQNALMSALNKTNDLHAGTVVLMEVSTGEIKAMVNLEKNGKGGFDETLNYAIGRKGEPGSVFKAATLTCLLEDGFVTLDTEIPAKQKWHYGKRDFEDHYLRNYTEISIRRGFEISSNNVFRMLAAKYYENNPDKFFDKLTNKLRITHEFPIELSGFATPNLKTTRSKSWNMVDLPQIAMGYTVEITPLHTLNFYNAIANGGVMVRPHLVKNYQKDGVIIKEFGTETIATVCRSETAATLREAMRGVVSHEGGTGYRVFKDCPVEVAGKTGTARIVFPGTGQYTDAAGHIMHQATFVGFFPYTAPKYSMIVVLFSEPTFDDFYGAKWGGSVFREITEKIYASSLNWNAPIPAKGSLPAKEAYNYLDIHEGSTPDVRGLGLKDALTILEQKGYKVSFSGKGRVVSQNVTDISAKKIRLELKSNETE